MTISKTDIDFAKWWNEIGSGIPIVPFDDRREHAERVAQRAWEAANNPIDQLLGEIEQLRKERDDAREQTRRILNEIDCRIEHGAESNGHLEAIRNLFKEATDGK